METAVREFFKSERKRLRLNQTQLAEECGLTQGMISRFEVEPDYDPTVSVFRKALEGLGHTLSSFEAQIKGLATPVQTKSPEKTSPVDGEEVPITPDNAYYKIGKAIAKIVDHESQGERGSHRRHSSTHRDQQAETSLRARSPRKGPSRRRRVNPK